MSVGLIRSRNNKDGDSQYYVLGVRASIGRSIPEGARFEAELTDEGILFRFVGFKDSETRAVPRAVPAWASRNGAS